MNVMIIPAPFFNVGQLQMLTGMGTSGNSGFLTIFRRVCMMRGCRLALRHDRILGNDVYIACRDLLKISQFEYLVA